MRPTAVLSMAILLCFTTANPAGGGQERTNGATLLTPALEQVIVVFKTHFDIGFTDMAVNIVQRYRTTMIDQALQVVDQNRDLPVELRFVWTIPGWPASKIVAGWPGQTRERQGRVQQAFQDGRLAVHALPFTTHTELLEVEDLVRGLGYASRLTRALGLELPRDAKMTDVPEHTWVLPTLLRHAGVEFMHIGCNGASNSALVPPLFWWEGPDGSRVLTMYSPRYGTQLLPSDDWPYKTWLALIHTGDNHGPPRPEEVRDLLDQAKKQLAYVNLFNNQWNTNFRLWNAGTWTSRVRLWAIDQYDAQSTLITPSLEARLPLQAALADGKPGTLPPAERGLELSRKGVLVTAFGPNPDGDGIVLRLWEYAGATGGCEIRLPAGMSPRTVVPVDLRGRPRGKPIEVTDRAFNISLAAFAPASFTIRPAD